MFLAALGACSEQQTERDIYGEVEQPEQSSDEEPMNVIFILSDDHRYDFMGFMDKVPYLETPAMDHMAEEGAHVQNAFVTTSLCSPSRASILTGQYTHTHGVVDNQSYESDESVFFPQYMQQAGYETAFIGKWHMGHEHDEPRRGFDHWVSFPGQGQYYGQTLNENGEEVEYPDSTYITDQLTNKAINYLDNRNEDRPFFMYLSHKGVHAEFEPSDRDRGTYDGEEVSYPKTMFPPDFDLEGAQGEGYNPQPKDLPKNNPDFTYNYEDLPDWVKEQRNSWHGVDDMYHGDITFDEFYQQYLETLLGVDRSIDEVITYLEENDLEDNTMVIYMGDNGFSFGEHGLIDKRHAYEESWRVPMLVYAPGMVEPETEIRPMIENIDVAPTILDVAGMETPENMDGDSFAPMLEGESMEWKDHIFYEYFWERPFPQTPTTYAVRNDSMKYIRYHGVWDINELYHIKDDPEEANNLIRDDEYQEVAEELNAALFDWLEETDGMNIPLQRDQGARFDNRYNDTY